MDEEYNANREQLQRRRLSKEDREAMREIVANPQPPTQALIEAYAKYQQYMVEHPEEDWLSHEDRLDNLG